MLRTHPGLVGTLVRSRTRFAHAAAASQRAHGGVRGARRQTRAGATIAEGLFPLVIISHGHAGSRFGHHDLAEQLARAGYVVAAVEHAGDS